jgi:hypothetical protein
MDGPKTTRTSVWVSTFAERGKGQLYDSFDAGGRAADSSGPLRKSVWAGSVPRRRKAECDDEEEYAAFTPTVRPDHTMSEAIPFRPTLRAFVFFTQEIYALDWQAP